MATMSSNSLRLAFAALTACALGGFWFGVTGALPRGGGGGDELGDTVDTSGTAAAVNAAPVSDSAMGAAPSDTGVDEDESDEPVVAPVKKAPKPAASSEAPTALSGQTPPTPTAPATVTPPPVVAPPPPKPTPAPSDQELPPY